LKLRGISGLISVLFLLIAFLIVFFSLYYLAQSSVSYVNSAVERESLEQKGSELSRSISGYYLYNQSSGSAFINLTNYFGEPVFISKILVIYSSGVGELRNPSNVTVIQPGKSASISLSGLSGQPESFIALFYTLSGAQASVPLLPLPQQPSQGPPTNLPSNLHLAENNLVLVDDFSTDPLASGRIVNLSGSWSWSPGSLTVQLGRTTSPSGENMAYLNLSSYGFQGALPNEVYVLVKVIQSDTQQSYADVVFLNSTSASSSMYIAGAYYQNGQHMYAEVRKYTGSSWDGSISSTTSISVDNPAIIEAGFSRASNSTTISSQLLISSIINSTASYIDRSPLNVMYIGLGSCYDLSNKNVQHSTTFEFVYVAKNRDPLYVYVEGIPQSYSVEIVGNDGSVYNAIYDQSMGMFKAYIFKDPSSFYPILKNAQILVMNGSSLVYSYTGDVCGGCVYSS